MTKGEAKRRIQTYGIYDCIRWLPHYSYWEAHYLVEVILNILDEIDENQFEQAIARGLKK